jgi:hypothetical protein
MIDARVGGDVAEFARREGIKAGSYSTIDARV